MRWLIEKNCLIAWLHSATVSEQKRAEVSIAMASIGYTNFQKSRCWGLLKDILILVKNSYKILLASKRKLFSHSV